MSEPYGAMDLAVPEADDYAGGGADVPRAMREFTDSHDDAFTATSGQILIAQPSDVARFKAMSGDVVIGASGATQIQNNKLVTAMYQDKSITLAKLAEALGLPDNRLASPNNGAYKTICTATMRLSANSSENTWLFVLDGGFWKPGASLTGNTPVVVPLDPADAEVAGLTQKVRLRVGCLNAGAAQTKNFSVALRLISSIEYKEAHAAINLSATELGKVTLESPGANARVQKVGADFVIPEAGVYALTLFNSGAQAAASEMMFSVELQSHNV